MQQVGLIRKWMSEYQSEQDKCWKSKQADVANHTVNMDDMQGSFIVLLLGFVSRSVAIGIELLWKKYQRTKEENIIRPFVN
ncbi:hypothetical protein V9T40_001650 [Parthenolecanium corni]|uniref:Uncharacterized protein n=1 Tax=Parthenolecanium corni TaxID=536013 RepID=A0AAN9TJ38_9HEMI